jgi:hypothetical protein
MSVTPSRHVPEEPGDPLAHYGCCVTAKAQTLLQHAGHLLRQPLLPDRYSALGCNTVMILNQAAVEIKLRRVRIRVRIACKQSTETMPCGMIMEQDGKLFSQLPHALPPSLPFGPTHLPARLQILTLESMLADTRRVASQGWKSMLSTWRVVGGDWHRC